MRNLILVFVTLFLFCPMAMASDIAFYVGQWNTDGWYDETQFEDVETIIAETGHLFGDIQQFNDDDLEFKEFNAWVEDRTDDGKLDIIWLNGCTPSCLYPNPNEQPDGSRLEAWLDGGNMVINVGDWFGYCTYEGGPRGGEGRSGDNGGNGAANILDLSSGIIVGGSQGVMEITPEGTEYLPSLNAVAAERPVALSAVEAPWEVAAIFGQNTAGTHADPVVLHNTETGGYVALINEATTWVDDRGMVCAEFIGNWVNEVIGLGRGNPLARGPVPKDGTLHPDTWVNITWKPGVFAVSHDVYFGDDYDAVNEGAESTFVGNQTDTFIVAGFPGFPYPDGLVPGTTYYWRIDEVNEAEPNSPWKGNIWSFRIPPKTAYFPEPVDGAEGVETNVQLKWTAGFGGKLHTVYFGETFEEVDSAAGGSPQGTLFYNPGELKMAKTYYWRVDEFDIIETHKGDVWSFTTEGAVSALNPANGAVDVTQTPTLTWAPGQGATYDIYFGADASALEKKGSGNLGDESYETGQLEWNTTYYWRVDEANSANADSPWTGPVWDFTTANFLIIDDMEGYNDLDPADPLSNRIFNAWLDGFGDPTNGSLVGYENPPFAEQSNVHSGNQSMPFEYDNSAAAKSEATLTLTSNKDWTVNGVDTLTIWYRGRSTNSVETMYVTLNGTATVNNENPDAALSGKWTEWNIALSEFTGVNLNNVDSITLGVASVTGGTGILFFDDIRLYPPAP
jgi:hypothetical protein